MPSALAQYFWVLTSKQWPPAGQKPDVAKIVVDSHNAEVAIPPVGAKATDGMAGKARLWHDVTLGVLVAIIASKMA